MSGCRHIRSVFPEALYGRLSEGEQEKLDKHLSECDSCSAEFSALRETVRTMRRYRRPPSRQEFMDGLWSQIEAGIEPESGNRPGSRTERIVEMLSRTAGKPVIRIAAAFLILITGIVIGRFLLMPGPAEISRGTRVSRDSEIVHARAEKYLERSKVLLLGILNHDLTAGSDFSRQSMISRELIHEAADLKDALRDSKELMLKALIEDMEVILLQIAYLESEYDLESVELIQSGIRRNGILFKINLEEMYSSPTGTKKSDPDAKKGI